jgi:hypothetical protein
MIKKKIVSGRELLLTRYGENQLSIEDLFDLNSEELKLFLKKKKDAPIGNLRDIYHCQSNRGLVSKIARETLLTVLWEVVCGKTFYFPGTTKEKIFVGVLDQKIAEHKRRLGKYQNLNLYMTDFRIPSLQVYSPPNKNKKFYNTSIYVNGDVREEITRRVNETGRVGGKIPVRLENILPIIYERFSYIQEEYIKLICITFFRRLRLVCIHDCDLIIRDRVNVIKFYYPRTAQKYTEVSKIRKEFVKNKLLEDKIKYFPCQKQHQTVLMN